MMTTSGSTLVASSLAELLASRGPLPAVDAVTIVMRIAEQVASLHAAGRIHGAINLETISVGKDFESQLLVLESNSISLSRANDWLGFLPELEQPQLFEIPTDLNEASRSLQSARILTDPRRIDLCQLGILLCRVLTGESADAFLRSSRIKAKVPAPLRSVLENSLGIDRAKRISDVGQFVADLRVGIQNAFPQSTPGFDSGMPPASPLKPKVSVDQTAETAISLLTDSDPTPAVTAELSNGSAALSPAAGESVHDSASGLPFTRLGHYEILSRIGRGGMGDVYLGLDRALRREVAIKVLPAELARNADFVRRFRAEAAAVAKLNSRNIVPVYFIGEDQGVHYYAMQYVAGESLAQRIARQGRLSPTETLGIVEQVLEALAVAHAAGMVHRDIKPGNVLLEERSGRALLTDFGLVKSLGMEEGNSRPTSSGIILGTAEYLSPEQGRGAKVDARSDLYSLGVLMYRLLSGVLPFTAENPTALVFRHVYDPAPRLSDKAADVPEALCQIVDRLLAKWPEERYQEVTELLTQVHAFQSGTPLEVPKASPTGQLRSLVRLPVGRFDPVAFSPVILEMVSDRWWDRAKQQLRLISSQCSIRVRNHLQKVELQMEGTVAVCQRRIDELQQLAFDAQIVCSDLRRQRDSLRTAARIASERKQESNDPARQLRAEEDEARCLQSADEVDRLLADQERELDPIDQQLEQLQTQLRRLNRLRAILKSRLRSATSRPLLWLNSPRRRTVTSRAALLAALLILFGIFASSQSVMSGMAAASVGDFADGIPIEVRIRVTVDGDDDLLITPVAAYWTHLSWDWPRSIQINGIPWDPRRVDEFSNQGETQFVPAGVLFSKPELIRHEGRGGIQLITSSADSLHIRFSDFEPGSDTYDVTLRFLPGPSTGPLHSPQFPRSPALLSAEFNRPTARQKQIAWAKYLSTDTELTNPLGMKFALIPPGEFTMGLTDGDLRAVQSVERTIANVFSNADDQLMTGSGKDQAEKFGATTQPAHRVSVTRPFFLSRREVTRGEYRAFLAESNYKLLARGVNNSDLMNPGFAQTDQHPVVQISHADAVAFCDWLSRKEGHQYRLPTEAEWEYACRAGTPSLWQHGYRRDGVELFANLSDAVPKASAGKFRLNKQFDIREGLVFLDGYLYTAPVGQFVPNAFGLYDMHGNVWEWCSDRFGKTYYSSLSARLDPPGPRTGTSRVARGGSWYTPILNSISGSRLDLPPDFSAGDVGFRVLREIDPPH